MLAGLILSSWLATSAAPARWMDLAISDRDQTLHAISQDPFDRRLLKVSERFLDTPYQPSPLGEGGGRDADPRLRFDAVDCLTFVEETIALSYVSQSAQVEPVLTRLRYAGEPTFEGRNHLMEAQWLPQNIGKGFVRDVTRTYGGRSTRTFRKTLTRETWASKFSRGLGLPQSRQPLGTFEWEMIPLPSVLALVDRIPSGTLLAVVREDRAFKPTRISHVGFVFHHGKQTYLRHATRRFAKVLDEDFRSFLSRNAKYEKWKVVGVSLFEVVAP